MTRARTILLSLLVAVLLAVVILFFSAVAITDSKPRVIQPDKVSPTALLESKQQLKKILAELSSNSSHKKLVVSHQQLAQLSTLLSQSLGPVTARYNYAGSTAIAVISIRLPVWQGVRYWNATVTFPDASSLLSGEARIGALTVSAETLWQISSGLLSILFDRDIAKVLDDIIRQAHFDRQQIVSEFDLELSSEQLKQRLYKYFKGYRSVIAEQADFSASRVYFRKLQKMSRYLPPGTTVSVAELMATLFTLAQDRSVTSDPQTENRNALFALALFIGDARLKSFLSRISGFYPDQSSVYLKTVLSARSDLSLHFIYSAMLQMLGAEGISLSVGELKEISDLDQGGSGFSFSDLAADRAGTRFARQATATAESASRLQSFMAQSKNESDFFPDITLLPDRIDLQQFKQQYQDTHSPGYRLVVREIDRRIRQLPLYKDLPLASNWSSAEAG